ncbi:MAG: phage recombination protein Bet [Patescibacteria group bacterium]|nr:phage recombination protein Bet [Patescibacteria group bacterium]
MPKTKAIAKTGNKKIFTWTSKQVELMTRTIAKGATMDELSIFLYQADKLKLDPLSRQIYFQKYKTRDGDQMTIITSIDGYRAIAERTKELAGMDDVVYDDGKKYEPGKDPSQPSKATVTIYRIVRKKRVSFTATARWKEYFPGDRKGFMWKKMPYLMLGKVAEGLALRKAFPNDLSGVRTEDEMQKADVVSDVQEGLKKTPKIVPQTKKQAKTTKTTKKDKNVVEGEICEEFKCQGCDVSISQSDYELSIKLSKDKRAYCSECLKLYRK